MASGHLPTLDKREVISSRQVLNLQDPVLKEEVRAIDGGFNKHAHFKLDPHLTQDRRMAFKLCYNESSKMLPLRSSVQLAEGYIIIERIGLKLRFSVELKCN